MNYYKPCPWRHGSTMQLSNLEHGEGPVQEGYSWDCVLVYSLADCPLVVSPWQSYRERSHSVRLALPPTSLHLLFPSHRDQRVTAEAQRRQCLLGRAIAAQEVTKRSSETWAAISSIYHRRYLRNLFLWSRMIWATATFRSFKQMWIILYILSHDFLESDSTGLAGWTKC